MHPILLKFGSFTIHSYGLCMAIGILSAYWFLSRLAKRRAVNENSLGNLVVMLVVIGLLGARTFYVAEHWSVQYANDPSSIFSIWEGGLMFYGSIIFGGLALVATCMIQRKSIVEYLDMFAVVVPLGQAFGRLGCFFNGCCHGAVTESPLGVEFPAQSLPFYSQLQQGLLPLADGTMPTHSLPVHPTQLYEAVGCAILFAFLFWMHRRLNPELEADGTPVSAPKAPRSPWLGATSAGYLIGYGAIRYLDEILRADERMDIGPFSISQAISICGITLGIGILFWAVSRHRKLQKNAAL